ncbi:hypothetical protein [Exiguobacterium alkaliphilum]|uniref:hypothetical protein n=1 Tax=Exiguobacterium alkaliphilum TaxID=1428684 RepID=UPI00403B1D89
MTKQERIQALGQYREKHQRSSLWLTMALIFFNSFTLGFEDFWWVWGIGSLLVSIGLVRIMFREGEKAMTLTTGRGELLTKRLYGMYPLWMVWVTAAVIFSRLGVPIIGWMGYGVCSTMLGWHHYTTRRQLEHVDPNQPTRNDISRFYRSYERSTYGNERNTN